MGHGRAIINIKDEKKQLNVYKKIISKNLSVRNTEKFVQSLKNKPRNKINNLIPIEIISEKEKIEKKLNRKISMTYDEKEKGKIIIPYSSKIDFLRIIKIINE